MAGKTKSKWWVTVAIFALLAVAMGALQWNWFAMPLERDEGEYAYAAWLTRTGKGVPYRDSFLQKPPMIVYTYGLVEAVVPESDKVGFRVAGFLAALATAALVWGLGKREFEGGAGVWGAWLWVAFAQQMMFSPVAANVEKFMVVPMLGAMAAVGAGERRGWRWGAAGALAAVAVLYKPICVPVLGVYFLWRGWEVWRISLAAEGGEGGGGVRGWCLPHPARGRDPLRGGGREGRGWRGSERMVSPPPGLRPGAPSGREPGREKVEAEVGDGVSPTRPVAGSPLGEGAGKGEGGGVFPVPPWRFVVCFVLGGMAAAAAGVGWFAWKGALGALWECAVEYTGEYAKLGGNPLRTVAVWWKVFGTWKAVVVAGLAVAGLAWCRREARGWIVVFGVSAVVSMSGLYGGHYYLMTLPIAGMAGGAFVERLVAGREGRGTWHGFAAVAGLWLVLLGNGEEWRCFKADPETLSRELYRVDTFVEAEEAGPLVASLCPEDGTVHVVGSEPELLWYARRKAATRFDIAYPMSLPTTHSRECQAEALEQLGKEMPDVVVFVRTVDGFGGFSPQIYAGYLQAMARMTLSGGYRLEWAHVGGGKGWVRGGIWAERMAASASFGIWRKDGG